MIEIVETILTFALIPLVFIQISWIVLITLSFLRKNSPTNIKNFPEISILIPAHNEEKNIPELLENINSLDYPKDKLRVFVIDNASIDKTFEISKKLEKKYPFLKTLRINQKGKSIALNYGLNFVKSDFVLIMDADTRLEKNSLKNAIKYFLDKKIGGITFRIKVKNLSNILTYLQNAEYNFNNLLRRGLNLLKEGTVYIWGCASMYRTKILKKVKFRELATEDIDTNLRIQALGKKIVYAEDCVGYTLAPDNLKRFIKQRIRWYTNSFLILDVYKKCFKKMNFTLKFYSVPFLIFFWLPLSLITVPLNFYSIYYWIPYQKSALELSIYFFNWFSFFGIINGIYNVLIGKWILKPIMIFGYFSGIATFFLITFSLLYYREKNWKNFVLPFFSFPYFLFINILYIFTFLLFLLKIKDFRTFWPR